MTNGRGQPIAGAAEAPAPLANGAFAAGHLRPESHADAALRANETGEPGRATASGGPELLPGSVFACRPAPGSTMLNTAPARRDCSDGSQQAELPRNSPIDAMAGAATAALQMAGAATAALKTPRRLEDRCRPGGAALALHIWDSAAGPAPSIPR